MVTEARKASWFCGNVTKASAELRKGDVRIMSSKNNNQLNIPEAREAMDKFKMEAAQDEDVPTPS